MTVSRLTILVKLFMKGSPNVCKYITLSRLTDWHSEGEVNTQWQTFCICIQRSKFWASMLQLLCIKNPPRVICGYPLTLCWIPPVRWPQSTLSNMWVSSVPVLNPPTKMAGLLDHCGFLLCPTWIGVLLLSDKVQYPSVWLVSRIKPQVETMTWLPARPSVLALTVHVAHFSTYHTTCSYYTWGY